MQDSLEQYDMNIRRYSVVGNDSAFKAYTKNYSFVQGQQESTQRAPEDTVLRVTLKENLDREKSESDPDGRKQYRVVHSDLMFVLQYSGNQNRKGNTERSLNDFRKLIDALKKLYPGCYVPLMPKQSSSVDLPQSIFEFRKTPMENNQVESFISKVKKIAYLIDSDTVQMFLDPRIQQP